MTQFTQITDPDNSAVGLERFGYSYGDDVVYIRAVVPDFKLVRHQTFLEPAEYGPALCEAEILWGDPITPETAPTLKEVEESVEMLISCSSWTEVEEEDY